MQKYKLNWWLWHDFKTQYDKSIYFLTTKMIANLHIFQLNKISKGQHMNKYYLIVKISKKY